MKVILAQPRGFCAGVVRAIEIVERALQKYGPPVYVRHEIVHNKHVVESLKAKGARVRRGALRGAAERGDDLQRAWRRQERRGGGRRARPAGAQRDLPAGHQGAQSGQALCRAGPQAHPDRPCRPSGGRRHDGPDPGPGDPGAERGRVDALDIAGRHAGRLRHADDAQRRRHPGHHRGAAAPVHRHRRAGDARHLLRDAEPPDRGARAQQAGRRHPRGRRDQQLQLQPSARDRQRRGRAELSDRRRQRARSGMGRGRRARSASPPARRRRRCWSTT